MKFKRNWLTEILTILCLIFLIVFFILCMLDPNGPFAETFKSLSGLFILIWFGNRLVHEILKGHHIGNLIKEYSKLKKDEGIIPLSEEDAKKYQELRDACAGTDISGADITRKIADAVEYFTYAQNEVKKGSTVIIHRRDGTKIDFDPQSFKIPSKETEGK